MKLEDSAAPGGLSHANHRRRLAQRVADAHRAIGGDALLALVSGSVVEDLADALSDVDMSVVMGTLPDAATLQAACAQAGGTPWFWQAGDLAEGGLVVAFRLEGIEVQIGYANHSTLNGQLDELLLQHNPDTPLHKLGEGLLKAEPLMGAERLAALKARLAVFPPELAAAMLAFWLKPPMPWRAVSQILHRDATLWCREILVEACWRQLGQLAALNRRYFTRFQLKRMHKLAASFAMAPPALAERIDTLLQAPPRQAFDALHGLEGEVLALVAQHAPTVDLTAVQARRADYRPN